MPKSNVEPICHPPAGCSTMGLSRSSQLALEYVCKVVSEDHQLNNGQTALYWHLVSVVAGHISSNYKSDNPHSWEGM